MSAPILTPPGTTGGGTPVGGSGTIGTIPKWDTTTTLNDSVITQSGLNIGIGIAPFGAQKLSLAGKVGGMGNADAFLEFDGVGNVSLSALEVVRLGYGGVLRVMTTGNVGIGTATPACALDVNGTIKTSGYTVGTLPAGTAGQRAYVTDATLPTYLGALVGGGAVYAPVFHNGTAWVSA